MLMAPKQSPTKRPAIVDGLIHKLSSKMKLDQWATLALSVISVLVPIIIYQQQTNASNQRDLQTVLERMARMETSIEFIKEQIRNQTP